MKKYLLAHCFMLLLPAFLFSQNSYDILIRNGRIIDAGNSWYYGLWL
jgi:hypothetical protein